MICPSEESLLRAELGELEHHLTLELAEHEASCPRCHALLREQRRLLADLAAPPAFSQSEPEFLAAVLERCSAASEPAPTFRSTRRGAVGPTARSRAPLYGVLALAACACLWLLRPAAPVEHIAARGSSHNALAPVRIEARLVRDGALLPLDGAELHAGDGITARYVNQSTRPAYLALFALDAAGAVHWIFPAYLDPASNPSSIPLAASQTSRLLEDSVEPEAPAPGRLRVVAVVSEQPLAVKEIERRLAGGGSLGALFAGDLVQEWSSTWIAR
jgi:hypothetical protein